MTGYELPRGYEIEADPEILTLVGPNQKIVGRFNSGTPPHEVSLAAYRHTARVAEAFAELQRLLAMQRDRVSDMRRGQCYPAAQLSGGAL